MRSDVNNLLVEFEKKFIEHPRVTLVVSVRLIFERAPTACDERNPAVSKFDLAHGRVRFGILFRMTARGR
jgi:hypothetical protein